MDNAIERRHDMEKHLRGIPFPQTRIVATDVAFVKDHWKHIQHKGVTGYDPSPDTDTWREHVYHQKYMYVEFAVSISHLRAIQRAWKDGCEYALILEDDARVSERFQREWYSYIQKAPDDWHMLNLYTTNAQAISHLNSIRDPFVHWKAWYWGASAYMLNRKGMAHILQHSIQGEHFLFNERIVVVDEYIASTAEYTYQATQPYIFISGALSTQQVSETFMLDSTYGNKINTLLRQKNRSVVAAPSKNVLVITHLKTSEDLEWLKKEIHYISRRHHGTVRWAVHQSHFQLPEHAFYFRRMETLQDKWDLVLMKHPSLSIHGFAWQTFLHFSNCATIVGAMPVHVDHFNLREWVKYATEKPFDPFKLRHWAQGNKFDEKHGHGAYGELKPVPFDVVPRTFALLNGSFFKWYVQKQYPPDQYAWCGAANEWNSEKEPCAMVPLGIEQIETLPQQHSTLISTKWSRYSEPFVKADKISSFFKRNMVNKLGPFKFWKPLKFRKLAKTISMNPCGTFFCVSTVAERGIFIVVYSKQPHTLIRLQKLAIERAEEHLTFGSNIPIAIATHNITDDLRKKFDYILEIPENIIFQGAKEREPNYWPQWRTRLLMYGSSPFKNTLTIDADIQIFGAVDKLFEAFEPYEFAMPNQRRDATPLKQACKNWKCRSYVFDRWLPHNGVLLFKKNEKIFERWWQEQMFLLEKGDEDDQYSLFRTLVEHMGQKIGTIQSSAVVLVIHTTWTKNKKESMTHIIPSGSNPILVHGPPDVEEATQQVSDKPRAIYRIHKEIWEKEDLTVLFENYTLYEPSYEHWSFKYPPSNELIIPTVEQNPESLSIKQTIKR
jgi:GR25 family glycosyltransferase involved in LPS biosynthesis